MNNYTKYISLALFAALVIAVIAADSIMNVNGVLTKTHVCHLNENYCGFQLSQGRFGAEFQQRPVSEEELLIDFTMPPDWELVTASVSGSNMYMGSTPVMFESVEAKNTGVTFLGSCNLAQMQWQMSLTYRHKKTANTLMLAVLFSTYA